MDKHIISELKKEVLQLILNSRCMLYMQDVISVYEKKKCVRFQLSEEVYYFVCV